MSRAAGVSLLVLALAAALLAAPAADATQRRVPFGFLDPSARIILAGFPNRSWEYVASVYSAGGRGLFDVAAVHPFTLQVDNVLKIIRLVRQAMNEHGDRRTPLLRVDHVLRAHVEHVRLHGSALLLRPDIEEHAAPRRLRRGSPWVRGVREVGGRHPLPLRVPARRVARRRTTA
jgi:hypothetical protein